MGEGSDGAWPVATLGKRMQLLNMQGVVKEFKVNVCFRDGYGDLLLSKTWCKLARDQTKLN